ncbi:hypothetical protein MUP77_21425 [Candidatus Bathyarchaeota archaeon]|nr:hypothetical protein [Candidatus Bathyarchaeota archaeon]
MRTQQELGAAYDILDRVREKLYHITLVIEGIEATKLNLKPANRYAKVRRRNRVVASERMHILLNLSLETLRTDPSRAQHYFQLARKMGMRYKVRLPRRFRGLICRNCKKLTISGINSRVRLQQRCKPHIVITCLECGGQRRIPLRSAPSDN